MKVNRKTRGTPELDVTPMIDAVFQLILFFMVIIALVVVVGIAIRFPEANDSGRSKKESKEKVLFAYVAKDRIDMMHHIKKYGAIKIVNKDFQLEVMPDSIAQAKEYKKVFKKMKEEIQRLIDEEKYKKDQIIVTGDMTAYQWKIVKIIDLAKQCGVDRFSLTPPR